MNRRILASIIAFIFVLSVFQYGSFAASVVDGTNGNMKIYDVADATPDAAKGGLGYRLSLNSYWQVADAPDTTANINSNPFAPISVSDLETFQAQPTTIPWRAVKVPSDLSADASFKDAHRVFYRAKIVVPESDILAGRSFYFDFEGTSWIASVFVNGQLAGTKKSTRVPWKLDVSHKIVAGENDIYIGLKSPRYAIDPIGTSTMTGMFSTRTKLSDYFKPDFAWYGTASTSVTGASTSNLDKLKWFAPVYPSDKGGKDGSQFGITDALSFVATGGAVYTQDAFVKTTVVDAATFKITPESKKISADVKVCNSSSLEKMVTVAMSAALKGGATEKTFDPQIVTLAPNSTKLVTLTNVAWADAKLWSPNLNKAEAPIYNLNVSVTEGSTLIDQFSQMFGFRDIKIDGKYVRVNGVRRNFKSAGAATGSTSGEDMIARLKATNTNYERFFGGLIGQSFPGKPNIREQIDVFDEFGIPITFCSMIDGMFASFSIVKNGQDNKIMFENFKENIEQMVQNYRNHPSIIFYSLENEFLYINAGNIYGGFMTQIEKDVKTYMYDAATANDPTRPSYTDGGCAGLKNTGPIYGTHYPESTDITTPSKPLSSLGPTRGYWSYDNKRPYVAGETMYFTSPFSYHNWVGGETAANNQRESLKAYGKYIGYMVDLYRWNDAAVVSLWSTAKSPDALSSLLPLGMITKDYKTTFFANKGYTNDIKLINDTANTKPITFHWTLKVKGVAVQTKSKEFTIEPGFSTVTPVVIAPVAGISTRTAGVLTMEMTQEGSVTCVKTVELGIFPVTPKITLKKKVYTYHASPNVKTALKSLGVAFTEVPKTMKIVASTKKVKGKIVKTYKTITVMNGTNLKYFIKDPKSILLVGYNGLWAAPGEGDQVAVVRFARAGGRVVVLEQTETNMLSSGMEGIGAWPIEFFQYYDYSNNTWSPSINFGQGFEKPILKGLQQSDLSFWNGGGNTANAAWMRVGGAKNWVTAGPRSDASTLFELPVEKGVVCATQLKVGQRITSEPAAKVLLSNMLKSVDAYAPPSNTVAVLTGEDANLASLVKRTKVKTLQVPSIAAALNVARTKIFILKATKSNLDELIRLRALYNAYTNNGGWVVLWGLAPDALASYNTLMGTHHSIRPFRREATTSISDSTSMGLGTADYLLYNSNIIAPWINLAQVSKDTFTYGIDATDEIAAFNDFEKEGHGNVYPGEVSNGNDHASMTDSLYDGDFWHYIWQAWTGGVPSWDQRNTAGATPAPYDLYTFKLPKTEQIEKVIFYNNKNYNAFKGCTVSVLADNQSTVLEAKTAILPNSYDATEFSFGSPASKTIRFSILNYYDNKASIPMCGVDEIQIFRKTPQWILDAKCTALNSNGTIVKYPRGKGGVLLNNLKLNGFSQYEPAFNLETKDKIFTVFFQNFGAKFS
ncbi:MAG: glycoside hydrolase family 2 TIM barrel-domain containing protein [Clostridia bacterium]